MSDLLEIELCDPWPTDDFDDLEELLGDRDNLEEAFEEFAHETGAGLEAALEILEPRSLEPLKHGSSAAEELLSELTLALSDEDFKLLVSAFPRAGHDLSRLRGAWKRIRLALASLTLPFRASRRRQTLLEVAVRPAMPWRREPSAHAPPSAMPDPARGPISPHAGPRAAFFLGLRSEVSVS